MITVTELSKHFKVSRKLRKELDPDVLEIGRAHV